MASDRTILRDALTLGVAAAMLGVSFGVLAVAAGLPVIKVSALSLLVFAGGAQFAAVGVLAAGGAAVAAVTAGLLLNARFVPFGMTVAAVVSGPPWRRALGAMLLTDETAALALAQPEPSSRDRAYWLTGVVLYLTWNAGTIVGALAGNALADPTALGLDAAFPAAFVALLAPLLRDRRAYVAALTGAALALVLTPLLPPGLPILGAVGGAVVGFAARP